MRIPVSELRFEEVRHNSQEYWQSVILRHDILRAPLNMIFPPDDLESEKNSIHILCWYKNELIGSLVLNPLDHNVCQMRQVCVKDNFQNCGIGKALVNYFETVARAKGFREIIMHARQYAVKFYEKLGYIKYGEQYKLIGMFHWNLKKKFYNSKEYRKEKYGTLYK